MDVERISFQEEEEEEEIFRRAICWTSVRACVRPRPFYRPSKLVESRDEARPVSPMENQPLVISPSLKLHPWRQSIPQVILRPVA